MSLPHFTRDRIKLTPEHQTMLSIERLHASVVGMVVLAATIVYLVHPQGFPQDLLGFVYGGGITYAGGRANASRGALTRHNDQRSLTMGDGDGST